MVTVDRPKTFWKFLYPKSESPLDLCQKLEKYMMTNHGVQMTYPIKESVLHRLILFAICCSKDTIRRKVETIRLKTKRKMVP